MTHSTSEASITTDMTTPTSYLRPPHAPPDSGPDPKRVDRLVERARRARSSERLDLSESALTRLARESFEAGFAAGAARALADQRSVDTLRALPDLPARARTVHASPEAAGASPEPIRALSPRRFEVLELVARGLTNPEIASVLGISANTVKAHLTSILEILDVSNRTEAAIALQDYERRSGERAR